MECAQILGLFVFTAIMSESTGGVLSRTLSPPCFTSSKWCGTENNNSLTREMVATSLNAINRKLVGAKYFAEKEIESYIEDEWVMVERNDILIEDGYNFDSQENGLSVGNCGQMNIAYEHLNELANYIQVTMHDGRSLIKDNIQSKFLTWQDEIYLGMCEMKTLLGSLNCGSCSSTVPSGNLSTYFRNNFNSEYVVDQQKAVYSVVLKGINDLTSIQSYIQRNLHVIS